MTPHGLPRVSVARVSQVEGGDVSRRRGSHGMQDVWGSNPHISTFPQLRGHILAPTRLMKLPPGQACSIAGPGR